ncbi:MAG: hypothetical protein HY696_10315 [Deltaproteobacteria bacterium]|nr:hypothetical protein [Deltaproteobacteria bacterium]
MKTSTSWFFTKSRIAAALGVALTAVLSACSDGAAPEIKAPETSKNPPAVSFKVASVADATKVGDAIAIEAGTGVTLSWEVTGADKNELSASSDVIAAHEVPATGSETIERIDTEGLVTFTLAATNKDGTTTKQVQVTVAKRVPVATILEFKSTAENNLVKVGEATQLCFQVVPRDAVVEIIEKETGRKIELATTEPAVPTDETLADSDELLTPVTEEPVVIDETTPTAMSLMKLSLSAPLPSTETMPVAAPATPVKPPVIQPEQPIAPTETPEETPTDEAGAEGDETGTDEADAEAEAETTTSGYDAADIYAACSVEQTLGAGQYTYILNVTDSRGNIATQETTVTVAEELIVDFRVNDKSSDTIQGAGKVKLSWTVKPTDATLTLEPAACDVAASTQDGIGSCEVDVAATTTYSLKATDPRTGGEQSAQVTVTVEARVVQTLQVSADRTDVFAGEQVALTVAGDAKEIIVKGPSGFAEVRSAGPTVNFQPTMAGGYYVEAVTADGQTAPISNPVNVQVRTWGERYGKGKAWVGVGIDPTSHTVLAGTSKAFSYDAEAKSADTTLSIGRHTDDDGWLNVDFDFGKGFAKIATTGSVKMNPAGFTLFGSPFTVHAFAFDSKKDDGKRAYAAVDGAILVSSNGGAGWEVGAPFAIVDAKGTLGSRVAEHEGCKGAKQVGVSGDQGPFVNVQQVCDLVIDYAGEGAERVLAATDHGVVYVDDFDRYRQNRDKVEFGWQGVMRAGATLTPGKTLFGVVVNDLELVNIDGQALLFAATGRGVYVNRQRGEVNSWEDFNGGEMGTYDLVNFSGQVEDVYTVTVDPQTKLVYAGTKSGKILSRSMDLTSAWKTASTGTPVYSLAVDSTSGALLIGQEDGAYLSRDGGATAADITASMRSGDTRPKVYSLGAVSINGSVHYAAATDQGIYVSHGAESATVTMPEPAPESTEAEVIVDEPSTVAPAGPAAPVAPATPTVTPEAPAPAPETPAVTPTAAKAVQLVL